MTYIIAECGVNHGGNVEIAHSYIDAAKSAGADAIKYQTWFPGEITGKFTSKAHYMEKGIGQKMTRYEMSELLRLPIEVFKELKLHADEVNIDFLTTPDGPFSLNFLLSESLIKTIKVGSTEINNLPFLDLINETGLPVLLSTGTANFQEVVTAVDVFSSNLEKLTLMQCTSAYPCPDTEVNLGVISLYNDTFSCQVGFSDHSLGTCASVAAVALGAVVIEKHLYVDSPLWTPDKEASLSVSQFSTMVGEIRRLESMFGTRFKSRTLTEHQNINSIRRKVVASSDLRQGTLLDSSSISFKRADGGFSIGLCDRFIGRVLRVDKYEDEPIDFEDLI